MPPEAKVAAWKRDEVRSLSASLGRARVVGVASIQGLPASQLQKIRKALRGAAAIHVTKNTLLLRALQEGTGERPQLEFLASSVRGPTAVITTDMNAFRLFRQLEGTKTRAPARGGELAPEDIVVPEGETPFKPGPIVGELQKAGIPAAIEGGKVIIKKEKVVAKKGARIPKDVAVALTRLEILPFIVGLDVQGIYEDGHIFTRDVLAVDPAAYVRQLGTAGRQALGLALRIGYAAPATVRPLLQRAHQQALGLAVAASYPAPETVKFLLWKAQKAALAVAARAPEGLSEEDRSKLAPGPAPAAGAKKEEKKEAASEEDAAVGLSSLFG